MSKTAYSNYHEKVRSDTGDFVNEYFDDFLQSVKDGEKADFHDYIDGDNKLHEHIDQYLDLREAVDILEQCENEETDSGLWEGLPPKEAVTAMAFWSFKADVYKEIKSMFEEKLNDELVELESKLDSMHDKLEELEEINTDEGYNEKLEEEIDNWKDEIEKIEEQITNINSVIDDIWLTSGGY